MIKQVMDAGTRVVTMEPNVGTDVTSHIGAGHNLISEAGARFIGNTRGGQVT